MKSICRILLISLIFASCKKSQAPDPVYDFTGSYVSSTTAQVVSTKLETTGNVSIDANAIQTFLSSQYPTTSITTASTITLQPDIFKLTVKSSGEANVDLYDLYQSTSTQRYTFTGNIQDVTESELIIRSPKADSTFFPYNPSTIKFDKPIAPDDIFLPVSGSTGYNGGGVFITVKRQRLIHQGNTLYLPMMLFSYKSVTPTSMTKSQVGPYWFYNIVDPDLSTRLSASETIVVQELWVKLVKQ